MCRNAVRTPTTSTAAQNHCRPSSFRICAPLSAEAVSNFTGVWQIAWKGSSYITRATGAGNQSRGISAPLQPSTM